MNEKIAFKAGQEVVYPLQGVGLIKSIDKREFKGETKLYYNIYIESSDMTTLIPVEKATGLGIRAIVPKAEAEQALAIISENFEQQQGDWKMRYQINHDLLKQGNVVDIATVVRALYHRSKVKELPIMERKLFDSAMRLLIGEISFSLNRKQKEIEQIIFSKLEPTDALLIDDSPWDNDDDLMDDD